MVAASYIKAQLHRASVPDWLRGLSYSSRVLMCTLQFPQHSPFGRTEKQAPLLALSADAQCAILSSYFTSYSHRLVPRAPDHWQDTGIIQVATTLRWWMLAQDAQDSEQLSSEVKTNFVQFLDVVIELMTHIYHACGTTSSGKVRQMLGLMEGRLEFHHDLAVTRLAALHYRCRALAASQYLYWRRCSMLRLSQVCRALRRLIHGQLRSERNMIRDAFEVYCPSTLLDDLTTTGPMLNRFTHDIQYSVTEEIALSIELSPPHHGPELWAGLRLYLALEVVMPGPRSPEDMALATSNALRATSPARVNSHRPAALPPEEAAAPPDVRSQASNPPRSWPAPRSKSIPLSADGHVSVDWNPPGSSEDRWADVLVTGLHEDASVRVAVGAWSGLDLRMVCCQIWCVPLESTGMGLYQWQGSLAVLTDVGPLEPALSYSENTVVTFTLTEAGAALGAAARAAALLLILTSCWMTKISHQQ